MIYRATTLAKSIPLDLLIHADHFTAEAAILASVYRRRRTRVLVGLHSGWPVDPEWAIHHPSNIGVTNSHTAAVRLEQISGMSKIFISGRPENFTYRSLVRERTLSALLNQKRRTIAGRKLVLVVANSLELNAVPLVDLAVHFNTLLVLASVPTHLAGDVFVAARIKPGTLGENPVLLQDLSGFSEESLSITSDLSFDDCVRLADCVVGVNVPTTAYFDVLRLAVPLLHVQTAAAACMHPDLPADVLHAVTRNQAIWPEIERILYDPAHIREVLTMQQQFVSIDGEPNTKKPEGGLRNVVEQIRDSSVRWRLRNLFRAQKPATSGTVAACQQLKRSAISEARREAGHVDDVLLGQDGQYLLVGWAADVERFEPAQAVYAFMGDTCKARCRPSTAREDVAQFYDKPTMTNVGFTLPLWLDAREQLRSIAVYAQMRDGKFARLNDNIVAEVCRIDADAAEQSSAY